MGPFIFSVIIKTDILFILSILFSMIDMEYFSSFKHMEKLIDIDKGFSSLVDLYLQEEDEKLRRLEKTFNEMKHFEILDNKEEFLSNPINVFHLIRHLTIEVKPVLDSLLNDSIKHNSTTSLLPTKKDLIESKSAILRLMKIYNITVADMACGKILPGEKSYFEMSAAECFELGQFVHIKGQFIRANEWFLEALIRESKENPKTIKKSKVLDFFANNQYKMGNYSGALERNRELLQIEPSNERARRNINYLLHYQLKDDIKDGPQIEWASKSFHELMNDYERLCRNEILQDTTKMTNLKCYYYNKSPYLVFQPIKVEDFNLMPRIAIFHDIITNDEIEVLTKLATPKLSRAQVYSLGSVSYRISKNTWLKDNAHPIIAKISQRLQDLTGLDVLKGSEELQMNNYGIGGHYEPHVDFSIVPVKSSVYTRMGNRLATVLFYMSDVRAGGNTVFPRLKVSVRPIKGAAVFWYNLLQNGNGDELTIHAGCPVLCGNKWVSNKWIHVDPQMFRKPCGKSMSDKYYS